MIAKKALWYSLAAILAVFILDSAGILNCRYYMHGIRYGWGSQSVPYRELRLRIVDERGKPVPRAELRGYTKDVSLLKAEESTSYFTEHADDNGEYVRYVHAGITFERISQIGYYPAEYVSWRAEEVPDGWQTVRLEREDPRVLLHENQVFLQWKDKTKMSFGIRLVDAGNVAEAQKQRKSVTSEAQRADLWIELAPAEDGAASHPTGELVAWQVKLTAGRGWEVAPGPPAGASADGRPVTMRVAPAAGYAPRWEGPAARCPYGYYLRWNGGRRYGKVFEFRVVNDSRWQSRDRCQGTVGVSLQYAVQGEARLLRSLNPLRGEELANYRKENRVARLTNDRNLLYAARAGDAAQAEAMLKEGANVNARDEDGLTPLMHSAAKGNTALVKLFLDKGADTELQKWNINAEDDDGTALMLAAEEGQAEAAAALLEGGADIEQEDNCGLTALMYAAKRGNCNIVILLLQNGANIQHTDLDRSSPLMSAAEGGNTAIARLLLEKGANINEAGTTGWTPLFCAVYCNKPEMVRFLIQQGADPNAKVEGWGSALRFARINKELSIIKILEQTGAKEWP